MTGERKPSSIIPAKTPPPNKQDTPKAPVLDRDKMSRALGAAFLQHQVQQLERNLDNMTFRRDLDPAIHHTASSAKKTRGYSPQGGPSRSNGTSHNHCKNPGTKRTILQDHKSGSPPSKPLPNTVKVIDSSMLIHALPVLKKWAREGKYKMIIPLDVISTLDFLKTSPQPLHDLVKEATRWLDSQLQKPAASHSGKGLAPQATEDECSWEELSQRFSPPSIEKVSLPHYDEEGEHVPRALVVADLPLRLRSLLQCVLWQQSRTNSQTCSLVIFLPSEGTTSGFSGSETPVDSELSSPTRFFLENDSDVASGGCIFEWASCFGIHIETVDEKELKSSKQWLKTDYLKKRHAEHQRNAPPHSSPRNPQPTAPTQSASDKRLFVW